MSKRLSTNLKNKARYFAGEMTKLAKELAPAHIRHAISSHVEEPNEGTYIIRTVADKEVAPDARAWEYGSGLRARRGVKAKYPIVPKTAPFLEFLGTNEFDGWLIRTKKVMHPGIQAANDGKGYIGPAQIEVRKVIKENLSQVVGDSIRMDLRESFTKR